MLPKQIKKLLNGIYPCILLEDLFPHFIRRIVMQIFLLACLVLAGVLVLKQGDDSLIKGALFLSSAILLFLFTLECYFYSIVTRSREKFYLSFDIGEMLFYADNGDLTHALLFSDIGDQGMKRLGFNEEEIKKYLTDRSIFSSEHLFNGVTEHIYATDYFKLVYSSDEYLRGFLSKNGIQESDFVGAMCWVVNQRRSVFEKERFWSIENLSKIPGIGKNWSYGETYTLERYGVDLTENTDFFEDSYEKTKDKTLRRLESVLVRGRGSNAIIVSDDDSSRSDIVTILAQRITQGKVSLPLQHKRVYLINTNSIIDNSDGKLSLERNFSLILQESLHAQNVILAMPNFSSFIKSAESLGVNIFDVLNPFIKSPFIHIIALDSKKDYLNFLSEKTTIGENFEMITTDAGDNEALLSMLMSEVYEIERESKAFFTFQSLNAIVQSADRYFDQEFKAEKCREMMVESIEVAFNNGRAIVTKEDVLSLVEEKTGIPNSVPKGNEKQKLVHLEDLLHERIVGQNEAVKVLSDALKRNRSGVANPDKPIGTFLFLGPTGVGKTETTKALAQIIFGKEDVISRFDMSEYGNSDAVERLIGSFGLGKSGTLSFALRQKPYGVLLLDEFEKTTTDVMNLFLRVFDEGVFTDAEGKKINAKNNIIIATSNAGSEMIWDIIKNGDDLLKSKDKIIESLIQNNIFKPELLNRFDAVVLFHPLLSNDLKKVAILMMTKFAKRMKEKGIDISFSDSFIKYLVDKGNDPKFGARPMNRAIGEEVERLVADKIIEGELRVGSQLKFDIDEYGILKANIN